MKLRLYTIADKRPDFLRLQFESLEKYLLDDFELIVINNAVERGSRERHREISSLCKVLGVREVRIGRFPVRSVAGLPPMTLTREYRNPSFAAAYPLKRIWKRMISENRDGAFVFFDSDMFLIRKISILAEFGDGDAALIPQFRGLKNGGRDAKVHYFSPAFGLYFPAKIPKLRSWLWDPSFSRRTYINGEVVDVGGRVHHWLRKNSLKNFCLAETEIYDFEEIDKEVFRIRGHHNGNFGFELTYHQESGAIGDFKADVPVSESGKLFVLPHLDENYPEVLQKRIASLFDRFISGRDIYPQPLRLAFLHPENSVIDVSPFIVHHKAGSGYLGEPETYLAEKMGFVERMVLGNLTCPLF